MMTHKGVIHLHKRIGKIEKLGYDIKGTCAMIDIHSQRLKEIQNQTKPLLDAVNELGKTLNHSMDTQEEKLNQLFEQNKAILDTQHTCSPKNFRIQKDVKQLLLLTDKSISSPF